MYNHFSAYLNISRGTATFKKVPTRCALVDWMIFVAYHNSNKTTKQSIHVLLIELPEKNASEDWQDQTWNNNTTRMRSIQIIPPTRTNRMNPLFHKIFNG